MNRAAGRRARAWLCDAGEMSGAGDGGWPAMMRIQVLAAAAAVVLCGIQPVPTEANEGDTDLDIEYAEHAPLAAHSLLLDTVRSGGRTLAAGERGHILYSDDDGTTWTQAEVVPTRSTLTALAAAGSRLWAAGHDTVILTSGDGGANWTRQNFDPERLQPIMDLQFLDERRGFAIGAYGLMLVTEDGGENWEESAVAEEDDAHLNSMVRLPDGTLLIAGEAGHSYRSLDEGGTWEPLSLPYQGSMFRAIDAGSGCAIFAGLRGHAMQSCDSGLSWAELATGTESSLMDGLAAGNRVLLVGNGGTILERSGAGPFRVRTHSSGVEFASILELGGGRFLLTGEEGFYSWPEERDGETRP